MDKLIIDDEEGRAKWERDPIGQFLHGLNLGAEERSTSIGATQFEYLTHNSAANPANWHGALDPKTEFTPAQRIGIGVGAAVKDLLTDGSRIPYWALNHPLAATSFAGVEASRSAGLIPDYTKLEAEAERTGRPTTRDALDHTFNERMGFDKTHVPTTVAKHALPFIASTMMVQASGNHDLLNPLQGGRPQGFEAVIPQEGNKRETANLPGEIIARYLFGRTGRLLPWDEFTQERPDVSPEDYGSYKAHQYDKGLFNMGLIKGTTRNIEGEPEFTMMGFRTPLSAVSTAGGAMIGGALGSNIAAAQVIKNAKDLNTPGGMKGQGPRRLAGALAGALAGGLAGNLGSKAVNAVVIQPLLNPESVAAAQQWQADQRAIGAL